MTEKMLGAAVAKSEELGVKMNIAIVDGGANLEAFRRMDGAWLGGVDVSCKKAKTARYFDRPIGSLEAISRPCESLFNIEHSHGGLITFPGGLPFANGDGAVTGVAGVSGFTVEDAPAVAQAALDTLSGEWALSL